MNSNRLLYAGQHEKSFAVVGTSDDKRKKCWHRYVRPALTNRRSKIGIPDNRSQQLSDTFTQQSTIPVHTVGCIIWIDWPRHGDTISIHCWKLVRYLDDYVTLKHEWHISSEYLLQAFLQRRRAAQRRKGGSRTASSHRPHKN